MPFDIVKLTSDDREELVDFIDLVFGLDFKLILPRLYQPGDECMSWQYAVKEQGRIRAAVGSFPMTYKVGEHKLEVIGIGNVAVHRDHRSKGYMKVLMNAALESMSTKAIDISWLGGQRQRYQYFGYETCGTSHNFSLKQESLKHTIPANYVPHFSFEPLAGQTTEIVDRAFDIFNSQPVHIERHREDFLTTLQTFQSVPHAIYDENRTMVGYLTARQGKIQELVLTNDAIFTDVLYSFSITQNTKDFGLTLYPHETDKLAQASRICDYQRTESAGNFRVFNFANTVLALLKLKSNYLPLPDGDLVIGSDLFGGHEINISRGEISVTKTEKASDIYVKGFDIYQVLFGNLPISGFIQDGPKNKLILAWFPLQLSFPSQDHV